MLLKVLSTEIKARPLAMLGGLLARPAFDVVRKRLDFREYGGGLLLGVNGPVVIAHGRSDELAMENAIGVAIAACQADIVHVIGERVRDTASADSE